MKKYILVLLGFILTLTINAQVETIQLKHSEKIQTYSAITTTIIVSVEGNVVVDHYEWDIYGDKSVIQTSIKGELSYIFGRIGTFNLNITAISTDNKRYSSVIVMIVSSGTGTQSSLTFDHLVPSSLKSMREPDGIATNYAIIMNGAQEDDGIYPYSVSSIKTIHDYLILKGYTEDRIYYLNGRFGTAQPVGVDNVANLTTLKATFDDLSSKIDADDYLFFWTEDHGHGYMLPANFDLENYAGDVLRSGEIACRVNTSKNDMIQQNVKYRPFCPKKPDLPANSTNLNSPYGGFYTTGFYDNIRFGGLDKWFLRKMYFKDNTTGVEKVMIYRAKYVSHFSLTRYDGTILSDNDPFIELIADYLDIDTDKDGIILKTEYDAFKNRNYDGAFTYNTTAQKGTFQINITDESKWQQAYVLLKDNIYRYGDDSPNGNENVDKIKLYENPDVVKSVVLFDKDLNNTLDIALVPDGTTPQTITSAQLVADGTDTDNDGMIDGVDFNENGIKTDGVGFDEVHHLSWENLYSNDLANMLNSLPCKYMTVGIMSCFSGGFIKDLSKNGRVIMACTQKYYWGFASDFTDYANALSYGDANSDGKISSLELYNYQRNGEYNDGLDLPQYDDNGDGIGQNQVISGILNGDGCLGNRLTLTGLNGSQTLQNVTVSSNQTISAPTVTVSNVTVNSPALLTIEATNTTLSNFTVNIGASLLIDIDINNECQ